ncbi:MAG TPA: hypothetical protein VJ860_04240 [Polyangia bacterium]|nr:hypothetical protein [Polyangia bacterium]
MATRTAVVCLAALVWTSGAARAETVTASATTIVSGQRDPRDGTVHTVVPFLELVSLRASEIHNSLFDDTQIVVSGWGEAVAGDPRDGKSVLGDVDVAYLQGSTWNRRVTLRAGRQFVFPGTAGNVQLDGLAPTLWLAGGVGLSGFVGVPVTPRFGYSRGEFTSGARAFWSRSYESEVGVSVLEILGAGRHVFRRDAGVDARYRILDSLALSGLVRWSLSEARMAEADAAANWSPCRYLDVTGDYRRTAPDLFLPRYSIFSVFAQETRDEFGGFVSVRPWPRRLDLQGDFHEVHNASGWGWNGGGKATVRLGSGGGTRLGVEGRRLRIPGGGYLMGRAFAWRTITTKIRVVADFDVYDLDQRLNGQNRSFFGSGSLVYDVAPAWRAVLTGMDNVTPYATHQIEGLLKIVYDGGHVVREVTP